MLDAITTAPAGECRNLVAALEHVKASALPELAKRADSAADSGHKARYTTVALQLGDPKPAQASLAVQSDPTGPTLPTTGNGRVNRGGAFSLSASDSRCARRIEHRPWLGIGSIGFRVLCGR